MLALAYVFCCLVWSTTWQAIRICLLGYPPFFGAALRFLLATLIMGVACVAVQRRRGQPLASVLPDRRAHLGILAAGGLNGLGYGCIYSAEQTLSGGTTAIVCAASPLFTLLAARLLGVEPLRWHRLFGLAIGVCGVGAIFWDGLRSGREQFQAMLLAGMASVLIWPLYGALLKRYTSNLPTLVSTTYFLFYTSLILFVLSLARQESFTRFLSAPLKVHLAFAYLTIVGSVLAWSVYMWLLRWLDLSVLSTLGLVQPLLSLALDVLLREAQLQPRGYVGAALVLIGMALTTQRIQQTRRPESPASPSPASDKN
ncbi:MAG: EamA family transporter [Myxococcales bacterium]|nr:EamA family transporter [Myxococcales bacterium]